MDSGYLSFCFGVYLIGFCGVILFVFLNANMEKPKEVLLGFLGLASVYTLIMTIGGFGMYLFSRGMA